jgi:hypothetical protein
MEGPNCLYEQSMGPIFHGWQRTIGEGTFQIYKEKVHDKQSWESQIFMHEQLS